MLGAFIGISTGVVDSSQTVTQSDLLMLVIKNEPEAITRTLAMMAYNPAIGRVLKKGGVDRFADLMVERIPGLYGQASRERFDIWHGETCKRIEEGFKTSRHERVSYGQAQKPLNVFMKVYMGWAKQPTVQLAEAFTPFLHVPLDSLVMKFIAREFPEEYRTRIAPLRQSLLQWYGERIGRVQGQDDPTLSYQLRDRSRVLIDSDRQGMLPSLAGTAPVHLFRGALPARCYLGG